jgi:hypothetical protein
MEIDYKKTKLDKNFAKFTINNDCTIVGDTQNISKLFDYFDYINNNFSDHEFLKLKGAQSLLNSVLGNEELVKIEDKVVKTEQKDVKSINNLMIKTSDLALKNILNKHLVDNGSLSRLIPDELRAIIIKHGHKSHIANIPASHNHVAVNKWFTSILSDVHTNDLYAYYVKCASGDNSFDHIDLKTEFGKAKYAIDHSGGLRTLFRYGKEHRQLKNVAEIYNIRTTHILKYISLYGFNRWKPWVKFTNKCKNWEVAYDYIAEKK